MIGGNGGFKAADKSDLLANNSSSAAFISDVYKRQGISSDKLPQQLQYVLTYTGKFSTAEEYGEIVLKALPDGSLLRLKDVATIEFDSEDYNMRKLF